MADNNRICGAKSRRTGQPCQRAPCRGRTRCKFHGGATPIGPASASFKHGRRSKWSGIVPDGALAARLERAEADDTLLSLRSDVALIDARLQELVEQLPAGASSDAWSAAAKRFGELEVAIRNKDTAASMAALVDVGEVLRDGRRQARIWDELGKTLERKRRLVESERRALAEAEGVVTVQAALLVLLRFRDKLIARISEAADTGTPAAKLIQQIDAEYALIAHQPDRVASQPDAR